MMPLNIFQNQRDNRSPSPDRTCKSQSNFNCPENDINFEKNNYLKNNFYVLVCNIVGWFKILFDRHNALKYF